MKTSTPCSNRRVKTGLFEKYDVSYVFIGSAERSSFDIDMEYFLENGTVLYDQDGILVISLK